MSRGRELAGSKVAEGFCGLCRGGSSSVRNARHAAGNAAVAFIQGVCQRSRRPRLRHIYALTTHQTSHLVCGGHDGAAMALSKPMLISANRSERCKTSSCCDNRVRENLGDTMCDRCITDDTLCNVHMSAVRCQRLPYAAADRHSSVAVPGVCPSDDRRPGWAPAQYLRFLYNLAGSTDQDKREPRVSEVYMCLYNSSRLAGPVAVAVAAAAGRVAAALAAAAPARARRAARRRAAATGCPSC